MLLKKVDELGWKYDAYAEYKDKIREAINQLEVIGTDTILNVLQWDNRIKRLSKKILMILRNKCQSVRNRERGY